MKVKELIRKLVEYNQEADIRIIVNNSPRPFEISFGSSEGVTKEDCDNVSFLIDCKQEQII